ncbi:hypothetical protein LCGC14_0392860 [marine sediment metagenome]|uniref:Portal protein n=1 Tax=marine sediment metagenome TaxID=412755 RepID=A0A0F9SZ26_9ZZZZ
MPLHARDLITQAGKLKGNWSVRDRKIRDWYEIIYQKDKLKQDGMESVVSNDPRTGYNLGKHLLTSSIVSHKISNDGLLPEEITATSYLESYTKKRWVAEEKRHRRIGKQGFASKLIGFMLATGWYSMFSMVDKDRVWTEIWNPIDVYPEFGSEGLIEVVRIYTMNPIQANRKVRLMGWDVKQPFTHNVPLYNYWGYDNDGDAVNAIVLNTEYVKEPEKDVAVNRLIQKLGEPMLPVFISPVGGLPDEGSIMKNKWWQQNFGEAIVATNEQMDNTYNKMLSFIQQTARTAAQPRWFERSSGDDQILTEEKMAQWGPIFQLGPNDEVGVMDSPQIPVELRTIMFEYSNMRQRGLFPAVLHGNLQQQLSFLAMANVASSALQVLTPYKDGYEGLLSDLDNYHFRMIEANGFRPHNFIMPENLPEEFEFDVESEIQIPGHLVQRATIARMLNPNFRLPSRWITDRMFPEIADPIKSDAEVRTEDAMMHPDAIKADQIIAYKEHARVLEAANDVEGARIWNKVAASIEAQIGLPVQGRQALPAAPAIPPEVQPTGATEPTTGLGEL